jgi:hypothetical protein
MSNQEVNGINDLPVVTIENYKSVSTRCGVAQAKTLATEATEIWLWVSMSIGADPLLAPISRDDAVALLGRIKSKRATVYATVSIHPSGDSTLFLGKGRKS